MKEDFKTRVKDVLPNTNRTQAAEITPGSNGMGTIPLLPGVISVRC